MRNIRARIERLEREAPGEWDPIRCMQFMHRIVDAEQAIEDGEANVGDIPEVPPAADPFWGGLNNRAGQFLRELCLAGESAEEKDGV